MRSVIIRRQRLSNMRIKKYTSCEFMSCPFDKNSAEARLPPAPWMGIGLAGLKIRVPEFEN